MHVVVDGSNLATEGRSLPSLKQLIEGVLDFRGENPDAEVVVVVDATFGHRIDDSERPLFEDAIVHQEIVSPPAGAIGRGDAFVLRIAEKVGATVLSNDSFQEFHAEHEWLFEPGRLIGGKPVPGIGWIFTPRTPVRGPRSREATQEAKRKQRKSETTAEAPLVSGAELLEKGKAALDKLPKGRREKQKKEDGKGREPKKDDHKRSAARSDGADGADGGAGSGPRRSRRSRGPVEDAIAVATVEAVVPEPDDQGGNEGKRRKRRRKAAPLAEPVNEPGVFLELVAAYRPGDLVEGEVEQFSSHGAFVTVQGTRCYIPLTLLGDPAPRAARDVLKRGEVRTFVLRAFDAARRGVELALPGIDLPVGPVADETAAAAVGEETPDDAADDAGDEAPKPTRRSKEKVAAAVGAELAPSRPRRPKKAAAAEVPAAAEVEDVPSRPRRAKKAAKAEGQPVVPEAPVEQVVEAAPRRRVKKATASVADESDAAPVDAAPRRRAKKVAAAVADEADAAPVDAAPKRRAKKAAPAAEPTGGVPSQQASVPTGPKDPPVRPRRAKKAAAPPPEAAPAAPRKRAKKAAAPAAAPVVEAESPAPRPRASRKVKPAVEQPAATLATDHPAPPPARKRAKKAAPPAPSPTPAAEATDAATSKAPAKRRASKKAAPT